MTYTSPVKLRKGLLELAAVSSDTLPPQATRIHRSAPSLLNLGQEVRPISGAGANFLFLTSRCIVPPPC